MNERVYETFTSRLGRLFSPPPQRPTSGASLLWPFRKCGKRAYSAVRVCALLCRFWFPPLTLTFALFLWTLKGAALCETCHALSCARITALHFTVFSVLRRMLTSGRCPARLWMRPMICVVLRLAVLCGVAIIVTTHPLVEAGSPRSCVQRSSLSPVTGVGAAGVGVANEVCPVVDLHRQLRALLHVESYVGPMSCRPECEVLFDTANAVAKAELPLRARQRIPSESTTAGGVFCLYSLDTLPYFELRAEMEAWMRARQAVGMVPEEYEHVIRQLHVFTNETMKEEEAAVGALFPLLDTSRDAVKASCTSETDSSPRCHWARAVRGYRLHANRTLSSMPWLLVDRATLDEAKALYARHVVGGIVVRVFHLAEATQKHDSDSVVNLLRFLQRMWSEVERSVEDDVHVGLPLLPHIDLEELVGPALPYPAPGAAVPDPHRERSTRRWWPPQTAAAVPPTDMWSALRLPRRLPFRHRPYKCVLPTAVVYHYSDDDESCPLCSVYGAAFDLLPSVFHRLCVASGDAVVGCSPLTVFVSVKEKRPFEAVPAFSVYGNTANREVFDPDSFFPMMSQLLRGEWPAGVSTPEYDVPSGSLPTVALVHQGFSFTFERFVRLLRRTDDFQKQWVVAHYTANAEVQGVLARVSYGLMVCGSIQLRALSADPVEADAPVRRGPKHHAAEGESDSTSSESGASRRERLHTEAEEKLTDLQKAARLVEDATGLNEQAPSWQYSYTTAVSESREARRRFSLDHSAIYFAWHAISTLDKVVLCVSACAMLWQVSWTGRRATPLW